MPARTKSSLTKSAPCQHGQVRALIDARMLIEIEVEAEL